VSKVHDRLVKNVQFNPKTNLIATSSEDCKTKTFKIINSSVLNESGLTEMYVVSFIFISTLLLVYYFLFKRYSSKEHNDYVTGVAWHPDRANEYLTCSWDGFVKTHSVTLDKAVNGHK
jgi:WD40 repeat protein